MAPRRLNRKALSGAVCFGGRCCLERELTGEENIKMENVIITGGNGFVGSNTVRCFLDHGVNVLSVGRDEKGIFEAVNLTYLQCDVSDPEALKSRIPAGVYDTFIHFAWGGTSGPARGDCDLQMRNALMTVDCLKAAKELGCSRFICAGSIMEHETEAAVHTQGSRPGLAYIYGMGKLAAHALCKSVAAEIGIDLIWLMITNAYGPGELSPRFINTTLRKIISGEPLQFTSAAQNYDFVYVTDAAECIYRIAKKGRPFCEYTVGSGCARPLREFIIEIQQVLAPDVALHFGDIPFTGTNLPLSAFSIEDTVKDTGFRPAVPFANGIRKTMEWLREDQHE